MQNLIDSKFLEFWGNLMLNAAQGQKQLEAFQKWLDNSNKGLPTLFSPGKKSKEEADFLSMFAQFYGADNLSQGATFYWRIMQDAATAFQTSFEKYISFLGAVPRDKYAELLKKHKALEIKAAEMEKTIEQLRTQLDRQQREPEALTRGFNELVVKQGEQFQEIMRRFQELYQNNETASGDSPPSPEE